VAADPATNSVYFGGASGLTVVNGSDNTVAASVALPAAARSVAVNTVSDTVYVALAATSASAPAVDAIDGLNNTVTATIPLPAGSAPAGIAVDSSTDTVYVTEPGAAAVAVIAGSTNSVTTTVSTGTGTHPAQLAVDETSDVVWIAGAHALLAISGTSNTITQTIPFPSAGAVVESVAVNPVSNTVYAGLQDTSVAVIDGATGTVSTTVTPETAFPAAITGVAVDPGSGTVFASSLAAPLNADGSSNPGTTWVLDASSNAVADTLPRGGAQVTVNTETGSAYETNSAWVLTPSAANAYSPIINSTPAATFGTGTSNTYDITASALPAATFTETGQLPAGVTLNPFGGLSGSPAAAAVGTYPITITASNGVAPDNSQAFTLTVEEFPSITAPSGATFRVGTPGIVPLQVSGNPPVTAVGTYTDVPTWLTVTEPTAGNWELTGTPPAGSGGLYNAILYGTSNVTAYSTIPVTVLEAPAITSAASATFLADSNDQFNLSASGYPAATYTVTAGTLPPGVTLFSNGELYEEPGLGLGAVGVHHVTITATNSAGTTSQAFTLTVRSLLAIGAEGSDGQLWVQAPQLTAGWQPLGGKIVAPPAVAALPVIDGSGSTPAQPFFIGTGTNKHLFMRSLTAGWQELGPATAECIGAPAAVITGTSTAGYTLTVACRGLDNALWENSAAVPASGLPQFTSGWTRLGGVLSAGPAAAPVGGTMTFFVQGTTGQIFTRTLAAGYQGTSWRCIDGPAASVLAEDGSTYFACQGTDHELWYAYDRGSGWSFALPLGGTLIGSPAVVAENGETVMLAEGTNHSLFQYALFGNSPGWTSLGGDINGIAAADLT